MFKYEILSIVAHSYRLSIFRYMLRVIKLFQQETILWVDFEYALT